AGPWAQLPLEPLSSSADFVSSGHPTRAPYAWNTSKAPNFWGLCIKEGEISRVGCPDPECVKAGREATEEEVARVVSGGDEEIRRWRWLREKVAAERDPRAGRFGMGEVTNMWSLHGPHTDCPISASETVVREYLALSDDSPERTTMERR
ncbi:hypothetical protein MPER_02704, partial [Moniliophthora perniciosa FA553]